MGRLVRFILTCFALAAIGAAAIPAGTEVLSYRSDLNGSSEVPPNQSKVTGSVTVTYDAAGEIRGQVVK